MALTQFYKTLSTPEKDGLRIGLFRTVCAIFGGLVVAYSAMTLIVLMIPAAIGQAMIVAFLFTPFVWSCVALWISLAPTRLNALLRFLIPSLLFSLGILILF